MYMINLKTIINDTDFVKNKLKTRNFDITLIDEIIKLSKDRSFFMTSLQNLESERNKLSKLIGRLKSQGEETKDTLTKVGKIKKNIEEVKIKEVKINKDIKSILLLIPNIPSINTPIGKNENENILIKEHSDLGRKKVLNVKPHYEIAVNLDIVDFKKGVKLSGSRFWCYKGLGSKLIRSLENFMLDVHVKKGYIEWRLPVLVKEDMLQGTGQLPKFKEDLFKIKNENLYLIPTAEVPLTNLHNGEILDLSLPILYTAFTPCFRAEAGSGGKDMKGLIRSHQFNKVELVKFVSKKDLQKEFQKTIQDAKHIIELLKIPYRELQLCSGDIGFSAEETIDLEIWIPSEEKYREVSSISSFNDFQARRASIRYKNKDNKNEYAYTINGSGLAIDRVVASILENYQNEDGTISIPDVLIPYMGIDIIK